MTLKTVSFVQPNFVLFGPEEKPTYYLPYTAATLWAYSYQFDDIKEHYQLGDIIYRRDPIDLTAKKLASHDIVGFSTYLWNRNYNYTLAKKIKELNPKVLCLFGGPEIPIENSDIFKQYPFMDIVVRHEGEITLRNLLQGLVNNVELATITGLLINDHGTVIKTNDSPRISDLEQLPSPYLLGTLDKIIAESSNNLWEATFETNRGCPYQCTFCDWGGLTYNKVKKFGLERVYREIEWFGKNKIFNVLLTDANFGIFPERDSLIVDKLIEVKTQYGFPDRVAISWAKNQRKSTIDLVERLAKAKLLTSGLTVSAQSMDLNVLDIIKRKNLDQHNIKEIFALCKKKNIPAFSELILGLPGETLASWKQGFWKMFELGNHSSIAVYPAILLENAEMNLLQKRLYKLEYTEVRGYVNNSFEVHDDIEENTNMVISTASMPVKDMLSAHTFSWFINLFHVHGFTTYLSRFLNKFSNISYEEFYTALETFLLDDPWITQEKIEFQTMTQTWMSSEKVSFVIHGVPITPQNLWFKTTVVAHKDKLNHLFDLLEKFIKQRFNLDENLANQLLMFNRLAMVTYKDIPTYPNIKLFDYDFFGYLEHDTGLQKETEFKFQFNEFSQLWPLPFEEFAGKLYKGRKRQIHSAMISYSS